MARPVAAWAVAAVAAIAEGQVTTVDLDDPGSEPLHFAVETLSAEAVTAAGQGAGDGRYHDLRAPEGAALTSTTKVEVPARDRWYVRVDLDGMVFSAAPVLATVGTGAGSGFESTAGDVVGGGAGEAFVVYRLPDGGFARDLTFRLGLAEALAVPGEEGAYRAAMALYDDLHDVFEREDPLTYSVFGGEATVVVVTSGVEIGIESGFAVAGFEDDFAGFVAESASGDSTDPDNPSAPAVLGSISVGAREASLALRRPAVYAAGSGLAVTAADVIESVAVTIEGDMTFGTLDLRTGTEDDRCLRTGSATGTSPAGGVLPLSPPLTEEMVTTAGTATLRHEEEAWGTRNLCVWLPERQAGEEPVRIPVVFYEATVTVTPPFGAAVVRQDTVGVIGRRGAGVDIANLTTSERYEQLIVIVNNGPAAARYVFDRFFAPAGVGVALSPAAAGGLNTIEPRSMVVLRVAETLRITGPEDALTAATLWFNAAAQNIELAVVRTNRADGSTDTVVYKARPAVRPEGVL